MSGFGGEADILCSTRSTTGFAPRRTPTACRPPYLHGGLSRLLHASSCHSEREGRQRTPKLVSFRLAMCPSCEGYIAIDVGRRVRRRASPIFIQRGGLDMTVLRNLRLALLAFLAVSMVANLPAAAQQQQKPNILVIMGDDVGWFNIGAYHRGIMSGKTPNLDKLASEGMTFTDYYAEASCTAGRANFITGELPIRTGLTTVGQAGADVGIPAQAVTLATALKAQGYATGQFGKNHLGDLNKYLPTVHGFDEYFGYLYHLDAMSDPYWYSFPVDQDFYNKYGPRSLIHSFATDTDDPTEMPRWGKVGKQRIVDEGPLPPFPDMSNVPNMHDVPF